MAGFWIASIPLMTSLPFLAWNAEGFVKSIAFSATRDASTRPQWDTIDVVTHLSGLNARLPILALLFGTFFAAWQNAIGRYGAAMVVMAIFISFNPVLFVQYFAWLIPLLLLAASEWMFKPKESDMVKRSIQKNQPETS
jgi:hypothetical protein